MKTLYHFFLRHAGYSYDPKTETPLQGRIRCAKNLAAAASFALKAGASFEWSHDPDIDSSEWSDERLPYSAWQCIARDYCGNVVASLSGIDFGRDGSPYRAEPYRRVVEAELAAEYMDQTMKGAKE